jgi:hypothetical protein
MFILTGKPFSRGTRLRVSLESGGALVNLGEGEVVWERAPASESSRAGFAIRFLEVQPPAQAFLDNVVKHGGTQHAPVPALDREPDTDIGKD